MVSSVARILIVGMGVVGTNLHNELGQWGCCVDKYKSKYYDNYLRVTKNNEHFDLAFICVDTPADEDITCDVSEVMASLIEYNADIFVIKSTVLPHKLEMLQEYNPHIVFSPEYYGHTQHCNNYDYDFTILGGNQADCIKVQQILQHVYDARHRFIITDMKTASLAKYMENAYLAMKVSFCNQFFDIAEKIGVDYEELRELFILDPRVDASHTFVYRDKPYWDSHCLNKDVPAIAKEYDAELLNAIIEFNQKRKP